MRKLVSDLKLFRDLDRLGLGILCGLCRLGLGETARGIALALENFARRAGRLGIADNCSLHGFLVLIIDACIVFDIRTNFRVTHDGILDGLGSELRINRRHNFDALETARHLGRRRLDEDLLGIENRLELGIRNVNLRNGKDNLELRVGLAILRADVAPEEIARRVLHRAARRVVDRDLADVLIDARKLILAIVELKLGVVVLEKVLFVDAARLPYAVLDERRKLFVLVRAHKVGGPALDLEADAIRLLLAVLGLGSLLEHATLEATEIRRALVLIRLGSKPVALLGKGLVEDVLVKLGRGGLKSRVLLEVDFERELFKFLDLARLGHFVSFRLDVPLLAQIAGRGKLGTEVARQAHLDRLALALDIGRGTRKCELRKVKRLKRVLANGSRHLLKRF